MRAALNDALWGRTAIPWGKPVLHVQDTAGREIYGQQRRGGHEEWDRDIRRAIGMDRIREQCGWSMEDDAVVDEPTAMPVALDEAGMGDDMF